MPLIKLIKKLFGDKRVRFLFVGGLNTVVGYGAYALLITLGINMYISNTLSTIIGVINSYFWNKYFTFRSPGRSFWEITRFLSVYGVNYLASMGLLFVFDYILHTNKYLAGLASLFITTVVSYLGHNYFSFSKEWKTHKPKAR